MQIWPGDPAPDGAQRPDPARVLAIAVGQGLFFDTYGVEPDRERVDDDRLL
jgi:hypothetical protein